MATCKEKDFEEYARAVFLGEKPERVNTELLPVIFIGGVCLAVSIISYLLRGKKYESK